MKTMKVDILPYTVISRPPLLVCWDGKRDWLWGTIVLLRTGPVYHGHPKSVQIVKVFLCTERTTLRPNLSTNHVGVLIYKWPHFKLDAWLYYNLDIFPVLPGMVQCEKTFSTCKWFLLTVTFSTLLAKGAAQSINVSYYL